MKESQSNVRSLIRAKQDKVSKLIETKNVFFAFSDYQFEKNKTPLKEGDKYISIGNGGYMPKSLYQDFISELDNIEYQFKIDIEPHKEAYVLYELQNHECFYTNDISDVVELLDYPQEYILEIYLKYA